MSALNNFVDLYKTVQQNEKRRNESVSSTDPGSPAVSTASINEPEPQTPPARRPPPPKARPGMNANIRQELIEKNVSTLDIGKLFSNLSMLYEIQLKRGTEFKHFREGNMQTIAKRIEVLKNTLSEIFKERIHEQGIAKAREDFQLLSNAIDKRVMSIESKTENAGFKNATKKTRDTFQEVWRKASLPPRKSMGGKRTRKGRRSTKKRYTRKH